MNIDRTNPALLRIHKFQKVALVFFYVALLVKVLAAFFPKLNFLSGVLLAVFFVMELFLIPPVGMAIMCVFASALFFLLPYVVLTLAEILIEAMFLFAIGAVLSYALSGVLITFVSGMVESIQFISVTAPMIVPGCAYCIAAATGKAVQAGTKAAVDSVGNAVIRKKTSAFRSFVGSLLVLIILGWPLLSYANAISGGFACKPAVLLSQAHLNHMNLGSSKTYRDEFIWEGKWVFESGFYDECIGNGNNNITQGDKNLIAGNDETLAYISNNVLYVQNPMITENYRNAGYKPKETDALIVHGTDAYVFGRNKVFVCGKNGYFTWKRTKWTKEFEKLSTEEQFDYVYDILERQNTTDQKKFSYDEVGAVAYAQRNGILIEYDSETHQAYFAKKANNGEVTLYLQSAPNQREELTRFKPTYDGTGIPYTMAGSDGILYLRDDQIVFIDKYSYEEFVTFTHPEVDGKTDDFISLHYVDLGERGKYSIYVDDKDEIWIDTRLIGVNEIKRVDWDCDRVCVTGFAGNYIYSMEHDNSLLAKLTYIRDINSETGQEGWKFREVWAEDNNYQRIELKQSKFNPEAAEAERLAEETAKKAEEERLNSPEVRFPAPELKDRKGRDLYDKVYIESATYAEYIGPQEHFSFKYPPAFYDHVEYTMENEAKDIDILFTCSEDQGTLKVSVHPLPADVTDIAGYAKELSSSECGNLGYGKEIEFKNNTEKGICRFELEGMSNEIDDAQCHVICQVDGDNVMKMVITMPNAKDSEEDAVKDFLVKKLYYHCGFGILEKAPVMK